MGVIRKWASNFALGTAIDTIATNLKTIFRGDIVDPTWFNETAKVLIELQKRVGLNYGGDPVWVWPETNLPTGILTTNRVFAWLPDESADTLTDRSGNGNDLVVTGTEMYAKMDGLKGFAFSESNYVTTPVDSAFQITGAKTIIANHYLYEISGIDDTLFMIGAAGETEATNILAQVNIQNGTGLYDLHTEYGAGSDAGANFDAMMPVGPVIQSALTFDAAGTDVNLYQNGELFSNKTLSNPSTGGTSGYLRIGSNAGDSTPYHGIVFWFDMFDVEFTAEQIAEYYQASRTAS